MDSAIPTSKIASLSSGRFVGMVADNTDQKIDLKMFHGEIVNDHAVIQEDRDGFIPLPKIWEVIQDDIEENYKQITKDIQELISREM